MYALLGNIQFDLITYFDGLDTKFGVDYAEHAVIEGKPRLQRVGDKLDEFTITLAFHQYYCDSEAELTRLRKAMNSYKALAFVLGNGDYKGWFVITDVQATSQQTTTDGTLVELSANVTLRAYVGDKRDRLPSMPSARHAQRSAIR